MMSLRFPTFTLAAVLSAVGVVHAQDNGNVPASAPGAYRVGPGDVLEVDVYGDPDLSGLVTVQHSGDISIPLIGDVPVTGLTAREVQTKLTVLLAKDFLVDPQVIVGVKEHRSQWITLVGEVVRPGKYYLQGAKSLLELLTEAGGFTSQASGQVIVTRLGNEAPTVTPGENGAAEPETVIRVAVSPEQSPSEQKAVLMLSLNNGDIVTATSTRFFFISGEVRRPGSYAITSGLTVLKAVSIAGGLTKFGARGKVEILRKRRGGGTQRLKVDLGDIERGKKPDVPLEADDIIKVGKRVF